MTVVNKQKGNVCMLVSMLSQTTLDRPWQWLRHKPELFQTAGFHLLLIPTGWLICREVSIFGGVLTLLLYVAEMLGL